MNPSSTSLPFQSLIRPELSLPRRDASGSRAPMESDNIVPKERRKAGPYGTVALQEAWDKLYRARAILEAEQAHLRDDRIALQGELESLIQRENDLAKREWHIKEYERLMVLERAEAEDRASESTISKLTRAPFNMARSVFGKRD
jgi:hypothetical protein